MLQRSVVLVVEHWIKRIKQFFSTQISTKTFIYLRSFTETFKKFVLCRLIYYDREDLGSTINYIVTCTWLA